MDDLEREFQTLQASNFELSQSLKSTDDDYARSIDLRHEEIQLVKEDTHKLELKLDQLASLTSIESLSDRFEESLRYCNKHVKTQFLRRMVEGNAIHHNKISELEQVALRIKREIEHLHYDEEFKQLQFEEKQQKIKEIDSWKQEIVTLERDVITMQQKIAKLRSADEKRILKERKHSVTSFAQEAKANNLRDEYKKIIRSNSVSLIKISNLEEQENSLHSKLEEKDNELEMIRMQNIQLEEALKQLKSFSSICAEERNMNTRLKSHLRLLQRKIDHKTASSPPFDKDTSMNESLLKFEFSCAKENLTTIASRKSTEPHSKNNPLRRVFGSEWEYHLSEFNGPHKTLIPLLPSDQYEFVDSSAREQSEGGFFENSFNS